MERISKGVFTVEFRAEAVKMVLDGGLSVTEAARRLSMSKGTLSYWIKLYRKGKLPGAKASKFSAEEEKNICLERENAQLRMEVEFLKKAAAYFAKIEPQRSTR